MSAPARICLESRYRKLVRGLPQTIFFCPVCKGDRRRRVGCEKCDGFGKLTKTSVQELIARRALPAFRARRARFHGAGREDIDVLMLGEGRPFVFEVLAPREPEVDLEGLRHDIVTRSEGAIELLPFAVVDRSRIAFWKEARFDKVYRCLVRFESAMSADAEARLENFAGEIVQRTPERVAHRRADLERHRRVEVLAARVLSDHDVEVEVRCQHGTYVKEWVSGDSGRSNPSVAQLVGAPCVCAELDVLDIVIPPGDPSPQPSRSPAS